MEPHEKALKLQAELRQERMHYAENELALAFTFLEVAKVTREEQTRLRNIENARKAYDELAFLCEQMRLDWTDRQRVELNNALVKLKARLDEENDSRKANGVNESFCRTNTTREAAC